MYDLRQFRPTLYLVLIVGVTGFALAAEAPLIWALALIAIAVNAWLVRSNRFIPLPRWLANSITILALIFVSQQILLARAGQPLILIGQFLVLLQIVKLFECRANRDYAQMLVLSLLLMVAGSINATSLLFAVILMAYLVIALYCCLLFHLKVETERARSSFAIPEEKISPATLRQDQRFLPRSMRRFTAFVAVVAITMAVATFLFFPRGSGAGVLGNFQMRSADAMTGFSENVGFQDVYNIQQNNTPVARVVLSRGTYNPRTFESNNEKRVEGGTLLLRGLTYNTYGLKGVRKWDHTFSANLVGIESTPMGSPFLLYSNTPRGTEMWHQRLNLDPTGGRTLFAMGGPVAFRTLSSHEPRIGFSSADDALQGFTQADTQQPIDYEVWSTNRLHTVSSSNELLLPAYETNRDFKAIKETILQIEKFTRDPAIIGADNVDRLKTEPVLPSNREIARRIEQHLMRNYGYTLDLSSDKEMLASMHGGQDPVLTFLTKVKKGHCEYFASAMTLMCQSIGIPARMVIGFKCDDYNAMGGYFIVRQSHAHAWCEVLTGDGWLTFDPTSGRIAEASSRQSWWQATRHFFDFLEYKWGENVIAYDRASRESTINNIDNRMMRAAGDSAAFLHGARSWMQRLRDRLTMDCPILSLSTIVVSAGLCFMTFKTVRAVHHRRLRHRAQRIGITGLAPKEQLRLAEQLAFYDGLITALARRSFVRPAHLTPREFTDHLLLPEQQYEIVRRLTRLFYRIRYGTVTLTPERMRRLEQVVEQLETSMG